MRVLNLGSVAAAGVIGDVVDVSQIVDGKTMQMMAVQSVLAGDPLTCTLDMEGSLDNVNWFAIDTHVFSAPELAALGAMWFVIDKPVKYLRANASVLTFTTAGTVDCQLFLGR